MNIQWYPGHMTKAKRQIVKDLALVDAVIELLDARIPLSSRNPDIGKLSAGKKTVVVLNKADLADPNITAMWKKRFTEDGHLVVTANSKAKRSETDILAAAAGLLREKADNLKARGRVGFVVRAMVVGVPNVGKSTLINQYAKRTAAAAADKPGVTKGRQWIKVRPDFEILDTPGILWPKLEDPDTGLKLAITGAIRDTLLDLPDLACAFISLLTETSPGAIPGRYKVSVDGKEPLRILEDIGAARGFILKRGEIDYERTSVTLFDEFRGGKLGRISLERP